MSNNKQSMKTIITVHDLVEALSYFKQDDLVVIDLNETLTNDLYHFYIDSIRLSGLEDSVNEIRLCPYPNK